MLPVLLTVSSSFSFMQEITGWYIDNVFFMTFVSVAIAIDHALGSYVHWKKLKDFSWKENRNGLFLKILGSLCGYILFEMLYQILQDVEFISMYLKVLLQVVTFFYPFMSAVKNLSIATNGKFPSKALLSKFIKFDETADLNVLKPIKNEEINNPLDSNNNPE